MAHLPLDIHDEIGNAPTVLKRLNARVFASWILNGCEVGAIGELKEKISSTHLLSLFQQNITNNVIGMNFGSQKVSLIAVVTTDVEDVIYEGIEFDVIILPTMDHIAYQDAKEYGINVIYAKQYDLDKLSFPLLAKKLKEEFPSLHIDFIEEFNFLSSLSL